MKPLFKVGQKVTIKDIGNDQESDYPFSFVPQMQKYKNRVFEITGIREAYRDLSGFKYDDEFDGFNYKLNCEGDWNWSSPMFQETYEL